MARLEKKKAVIVFANILYQIFLENGEEYPLSFDEFSVQLVKKMYKEFKVLEGNQIIFDKVSELSAQPTLGFSNEIELIEDTPEIENVEILQEVSVHG